jgi:hypothetical protein
MTVFKKLVHLSEKMQLKGLHFHPRYLHPGNSIILVPFTPVIHFRSWAGTENVTRLRTQGAPYVTRWIRSRPSSALGHDGRAPKPAMRPRRHLSMRTGCSLCPRRCCLTVHSVFTGARIASSTRVGISPAAARSRDLETLLHTKHAPCIK